MKVKQLYGPSTIETVPSKSIGFGREQKYLYKPHTTEQYG